nr:MAG TPA: hypothetical protein [Caudoviricetes sp.]
MSRTKFCIIAVVTLVTFGFAVYVHSSDKLVRGIVVEKSEIPEHYETIDNGVLPYEQKYINARYFVTLSFRNRKEKIAVDWVTFDKAIIGNELIVKR